MKTSEKIVVLKMGSETYRVAFVQNGETTMIFEGTHRDCMERVLHTSNPETLDGIRKVRIAPAKGKVW